MKRSIFMLLILACVPVLVRGDEPDNAEAYQRTVGSVVLISTVDRNWDTSFGTGIIIDAQRGDILTAYHVVGAGRLVVAITPALNKDGEIITDVHHYENATTAVAGRCIVLAQNVGHDLALIRLKTPRAGLKALPLAAKSASPGQPLFGIGHGAGMLWRFSGGTARSISDDSYTSSDGQKVSGRLLRTSCAVDPGDSGGPLVSRGGELLGVMVSMRKDLNLVQNSIDVSEVREFIQAARVMLKEDK